MYIYILFSLFPSALSLFAFRHLCFDGTHTNTQVAGKCDSIFCCSWGMISLKWIYIPHTISVTITITIIITKWKDIVVKRTEAICNTHTRVCPQSISFHHKWIFHGLHSFIHRFPFISFALGLHFSTLTHSFSLALSLSLLLQHVRTHTSISISIFQYVGDIIADCIICKFLYFIGSTKIHLPKPMKQ